MNAFKTERSNSINVVAQDDNAVGGGKTQKNEKKP